MMTMPRMIRKFVSTIDVLHLRFSVVAVWTLLFVQGESIDYVRKSQRNLLMKFERSPMALDVRQPGIAGNPRSITNSQYDSYNPTILFQNRLSQLKQSRSNPDDILGSDSQVSGSANDEASDSYGEWKSRRSKT